MTPLPRPRQYFYGAPHTYINIWLEYLTGRIYKGDEITRLEEAFAQRLNCRHAITMPQNRVGLYLVLNTLPPDRKNVILSPYTIYDVVNMVVSAGCTPVFADVEPETGNISLDDASQLVNEKTGAIIVTHLHGIGADILGFRELCDKYDLMLIEDCAQSLGAEKDGLPLGAYGDVGIFSFGMAKNLNTLYGGMVVTDDNQLADNIRTAMKKWPVFPMRKLLARANYLALSDTILNTPLFPLLTFRIFRYGYMNKIKAITNRLRGEDNPILKTTLPEDYKVCLSAAQARLAMKQLPFINVAASERQEYARIYANGLSDIDELIIPPFRERHEDVFLTFPVQPPEREPVIRYLMHHGIDVDASHYHNCADVEAFATFRRECPNARETARRMMYLPCYPGFGRARVEKIVRLLREYFGADTLSDCSTYPDGSK